MARVMSLYRRHTSRRAAAVAAAPEQLDAVASRTGDRLYLHVVNTSRTQAQQVRLTVRGMTVRSGCAFEIAAPPETELLADRSDNIAPRKKELTRPNRWTFPAASVTALELDVQS